MIRSLVLSAVLAGSLAAQASTGGAPITIDHSGYLLDATDHPVSGTVSLAFGVWDDPTGGALQWEGACSVAVQAGYFTVALGAGACAGTGGAGDHVLDTSDVPGNAPRWLELRVGSTAMSPRLALLPAATATVALRAYEADKLGGHPATDFAASTHTHSAGDVTNFDTQAVAAVTASGAFAAATHSHVEADPKVGTLTDGKWCAALGGKVVCTNDAPVLGSGQANAGGSAATCGPLTQGYLSYDTSNPSAPVLKVCNGSAYVALGSPVTAPPGAPGAITSTPGTSQVTIGWGAVVGAASYEVGYQIGTTITGAATTVAVPSGTSKIVTGLTNDQIYAFAVRSIAGLWASPWSATVTSTPRQIATIVTAGAGRTWSDGTYAASCNGYKNPSGLYAYSGVVGDGAYTIDPDGASSGTPFNVWCDMTTAAGGWTLVAKATGAAATTLHGDDVTRWISKSYVGDTATLTAEEALGRAYDSVGATSVLIRSLTDGAKRVAWQHPSAFTSLFAAVSPKVTRADGVLIDGSVQTLDYRSGCSGPSLPAAGGSFQYGFVLPDSHNVYTTSFFGLTIGSWSGSIVGWRGTANQCTYYNSGGGFGFKSNTGQTLAFGRHTCGYGSDCSGASWPPGVPALNPHGLFVR